MVTSTTYSRIVKADPSPLCKGGGRRTRDGLSLAIVLTENHESWGTVWRIELFNFLQFYMLYNLYAYDMPTLQRTKT